MFGVIAVGWCGRPASAEASRLVETVTSPRDTQVPRGGPASGLRRDSRRDVWM